MKNLKIFGTLVYCIFANTLYSQNWQLGGNGIPQLTSTNNWIGSDATSVVPLRFFTVGSEKMRLYTNPGLAIHRLPNTPTTSPGALLHIGDNLNPLGSAGHRNWMNVGTFYFRQTDNMYVGMKDETALWGTSTNFSSILLKYCHFI